MENGPEGKPPQARGSFSRLDLVIPRWVAPQQSPTLFHQATGILAHETGAWLPYQPNAPTGKHVDRRDPIPAKRAHRLPPIAQPAESKVPALATARIRGNNR